MQMNEESIHTMEKKQLIYQGKWCPYCNMATQLIDSKDFYKDGFSYGYMYVCPNCGAYVGCHKYTKVSFGSVADEERDRGHHYFDQIWRRRIIHRPGAYKLLSQAMGIDFEYTHFGMFDKDKCLHAISFCLKILAERKEYIYAYDDTDFEFINANFSPVYAVKKKSV